MHPLPPSARSQDASDWTPVSPRANLPDGGTIAPANRLQLLESAVVNSYDSIVITDAGNAEHPSPRILFVNEAFTRLSGYSLAEAVGRSPGLLQGPESDRGEIARMRRCLGLGEVFTSELVNYRKDGSPFHVEVRIMPIRNEAGLLTHWVGVQRDISARKKAAREREQLEARLREKQKLESLGVLAGGIAHDFNNLLTIILGNASLARLDVQRAETVERSLHSIEAAAVRAADLCRQMLAYSGQGRFVIKPINLNTILTETIELLRHSSACGRRLELGLAPDLAAVSADPSQIQQVAMNLLLNAAEATEPKTGTIRVGTRHERLRAKRLARAHLGADLPGGDYVILEVADNGAGISRDIQERIFDPFFTTKFTGRGLGLAAVLGIVRAHHGAIEVESEPGRGATFRVFLPACAQPAAILPPAAPPAPLDGRGRTLLIADDERVLRETMRELLEQFGFEVLIAADGREAVEIFRQNHRNIAATLLDFSMPQVDGAAAFAEIRALAPASPVVLMSGYSREEAIARFDGQGLSGFLQKPFAMEALVQTLAAVLPEAERDPANR